MFCLHNQEIQTNKNTSKSIQKECHNLSPQFILSFWCFIHSYWGTSFRSPQITLQPPASTRAGLSYMENEWMWQAHARVFTTLNMRSHLTVINLLTILTSVTKCLQYVHTINVKFLYTKLWMKIQNILQQFLIRKMFFYKYKIDFIKPTFLNRVLDWVHSWKFNISRGKKIHIHVLYLLHFWGIMYIYVMHIIIKGGRSRNLI